MYKYFVCRQHSAIDAAAYIDVFNIETSVCAKKKIASKKEEQRKKMKLIILHYQRCSRGKAEKKNT